MFAGVCSIYNFFDLRCRPPANHETQTGVGGVLYPYIMSGLLNHFGYKTAMISMGVGYAILGTISLIPVNRRVPVSRHDFVGPGRKKPINLTFLRSTPGIIGPLIILLVSLGNFIPTLWLPCTFLYLLGYLS